MVLKLASNLGRIAIVILTVLISGCSTPRIIGDLPPGRVVKDHDPVRNVTRVRLNLEHKRAEERRSSFISASQSFLREVMPNGRETITVFVVFRMQPESFPVENTIFILADNQPAALHTTHIDFTEVGRLIAAGNQTGNIGTIDALEAWESGNYAVSRFSYTLTPQIIEMLKNGRRIFFRHYSGSEIITLRLSLAERRDLKRFLNKR